MKNRTLLLALALAGAPAPLAAQSVFDAPVSDDALGAVTGQADIAIVAQSQETGIVANNSVGDNVLTGDVRLDQNAFQNLSGISLLNFNTGNNVSMNSALNVSIQINPGP